MTSLLCLCCICVHAYPIPAHFYSGIILQPCKRVIVCLSIEGPVLCLRCICVPVYPVPAHVYYGIILQPCKRAIVCFLMGGPVQGATRWPSVTIVVQMPFLRHSTEVEGVRKQWAAITKLGPLIFNTFFGVS